jgi:hypothetical protein
MMASVLNNYYGWGDKQTGRNILARRVEKNKEIDISQLNGGFNSELENLIDYNQNLTGETQLSTIKTTVESQLSKVIKKFNLKGITAVNCTIAEEPKYSYAEMSNHWGILIGEHLNVAFERDKSSKARSESRFVFLTYGIPEQKYETFSIDGEKHSILLAGMDYKCVYFTMYSSYEQAVSKEAAIEEIALPKICNRMIYYKDKAPLNYPDAKLLRIRRIIFQLT